MNIKMPGTSRLIEELTASVEGVQRVLTNLLTANSDPQARQPLRDTKEILAEKLRAVPQLFHSIPPTVTEQRVPELSSASIWPRRQQLQPLQQHQAVVQRAHTSIAPALQPDTTAPLQRVPATPLQSTPAAVSRQRVPTVILPAVTFTVVPSSINNNSPTMQADPIVIQYRPNQPSNLHRSPRTCTSTLLLLLPRFTKFQNQSSNGWACRASM
jgi:hypothetical protein